MNFTFNKLFQAPGKGNLPDSLIIRPINSILRKSIILSASTEEIPAIWEESCLHKNQADKARFSETNVDIV